jgi:acetyl esterase/lipase
MPPLLLITGTADRLWPQTEAFARRLAELQVEHEVLALDGAPHGMESWDGHPEWTVYKERLTEWIRRLARRAAKASGH